MEINLSYFATHDVTKYITSKIYVLYSFVTFNIQTSTSFVEVKI